MKQSRGKADTVLRRGGCCTRWHELLSEWSPPLHRLPFKEGHANDTYSSYVCALMMIWNTVGVQKLVKIYPVQPLEERCTFIPVQRLRKGYFNADGSYVMTDLVCTVSNAGGEAHHVIIYQSQEHFSKGIPTLYTRADFVSRIISP